MKEPSPPRLSGWENSITLPPLALIVSQLVKLCCGIPVTSASPSRLLTLIPVLVFCFPCSMRTLASCMLPERSVYSPQTMALSNENLTLFVFFHREI